jgi:hypothetical protein
LLNIREVASSASQASGIKCSSVRLIKRCTPCHVDGNVSTAYVNRLSKGAVRED